MNTDTRNLLIDQLSNARHLNLPNAHILELAQQLVHECRCLEIESAAREDGVVVDEKLMKSILYDPFVA